MVEVLNYITWMGVRNRYLKQGGFSVPHQRILKLAGWLSCESVNRSQPSIENLGMLQ